MITYIVYFTGASHWHSHPAVLTPRDSRDSRDPGSGQDGADGDDVRRGQRDPDHHSSFRRTHCNALKI
jgi:hypothetical protein